MTHIYDDSHPRQGSLRFLHPFQNAVPLQSYGLYLLPGFSVQYFQTTVWITVTEGSRTTMWAYCVPCFSSRWVWFWDCLHLFCGQCWVFLKEIKALLSQQCKQNKQKTARFRVFCYTLWFYSCFSPMEINHSRVLEIGRICKPAVEINDANWNEGSPVSRKRGLHCDPSRNSNHLIIAKHFGIQVRKGKKKK